MHIERYKDKLPKISSKAKIFYGAALSGDIEIADGVNIWYNVSMRGDMSYIKIGENTNIQDNSVVHTNLNQPCIIGKNVTVGHNAILHACTVEDDCLIGMGSIVLDGATVEQGALVGAGCVVPPGKTVPSKHLAVGNPMKIVRELTDKELEANKKNKDYYLQLMNDY